MRHDFKETNIVCTLGIYMHFVQTAQSVQKGRMYTCGVTETELLDKCTTWTSLSPAGTTQLDWTVGRRS